VLAGAVAALNGAPSWASKPYYTWTDLELKEVLNDSSWADKGGISYIKTNGASSQPIEDVALISWVSAVPMRQAALRQQFGASTTPSKEAEALLAQTLSQYVVSVKVSGGAQSSSYATNASGMQAETFLLREGKPPIAAVQSDARMLDKDGKVVEMPAPRGGGGRQPGAPAAPGAPGGAAPPAGRSQQMGVVPSAFQRGGGGGGFGGGGGGFGGPPGGGGGGPRATTSIMLYMFPKTDAITIADKEVEFVTKLCSRGGGGFGGGGGRGAAPGAAPAAASASNCQYSVKKKFKLKDMMYNGELAL